MKNYERALARDIAREVLAIFVKFGAVNESDYQGMVSKYGDYGMGLLERLAIPPKPKRFLSGDKVSYLGIEYTVSYEQWADQHQHINVHDDMGIGHSIRVGALDQPISGETE